MTVGSGSQSTVSEYGLQTSAITSLGNGSEMPAPEPNSDLLNQKLWEQGSRNPWFNKLSRCLWCMLKFQNHWPLGTCIQPVTCICISLPAGPRQSCLGINCFHKRKRHKRSLTLLETWGHYHSLPNRTMFVCFPDHFPGNFLLWPFPEMFLWVPDLPLATKIILYILSFFAKYSGHLSWSLLISNQLIYDTSMHASLALSPWALSALHESSPILNFPGPMACTCDMLLPSLWVLCSWIFPCAGRGK